MSLSRFYTFRSLPKTFSQTFFLYPKHAHKLSYDYDGPISESGAMGYGSDGANKFLAIKQVSE